MLHVVGGAESGQRDARHGALPPQGLEQLEPVAVGQLDVADEQVDLGISSRAEGRLHALGRADVVPAAIQQLGEREPRVVVVVNQQDAERPAGRWLVGGDRLDRWHRGWGARPWASRS